MAFKAFIATQNRDREAKKNGIATLAAVENLPVVDESGTSWEQVLEFRKDQKALGHHRDLRVWLYHVPDAESEGHVQDVIGQKIDDYTSAIRKQGLRTVLGGIASLTAVAAGSTLASLLGKDLGELLQAGLLAASGVSAGVAKRLVDLSEIERGDNREVAVIYDAKRSFE